MSDSLCESVCNEIFLESLGDESDDATECSNIGGSESVPHLQRSRLLIDDEEDLFSGVASDHHRVSQQSFIRKPFAFRTRRRMRRTRLKAEEVERTNGLELWNACLSGDDLYVQQTISMFPNLIHLEQQGRTPLYLACQAGHVKIADLLLQAGAMDMDGTVFASSQHPECRALLQQYKIIEDTLNGTPSRSADESSSHDGSNSTPRIQNLSSSCFSPSPKHELLNRTQTLMTSSVCAASSERGYLTPQRLNVIASVPDTPQANDISMLDDDCSTTVRSSFFNGNRISSEVHDVTSEHFVDDEHEEEVDGAENHKIELDQHENGDPAENFEYVESDFLTMRKRESSFAYRASSLIRSHTNTGVRRKSLPRQHIPSNELKSLSNLTAATSSLTAATLSLSVAKSSITAARSSLTCAGSNPLLLGSTDTFRKRPTVLRNIARSCGGETTKSMPNQLSRSEVPWGIKRENNETFWKRSTPLNMLRRSKLTPQETPIIPPLQIAQTMLLLSTPNEEEPTENTGYATTESPSPPIKEGVDVALKRSIAERFVRSAPPEDQEDQVVIWKSSIPSEKVIRLEDEEDSVLSPPDIQRVVEGAPRSFNSACQSKRSESVESEASAASTNSCSTHESGSYNYSLNAATTSESACSESYTLSHLGSDELSVETMEAPTSEIRDLPTIVEDLEVGIEDFELTTKCPPRTPPSSSALRKARSLLKSRLSRFASKRKDSGEPSEDVSASSVASYPVNQEIHVSFEVKGGDDTDGTSFSNNSESSDSSSERYSACSTGFPEESKPYCCLHGIFASPTLNTQESMS